MESKALERPTIERYLATVRERVRALGVLLGPAGNESGAIQAAVAFTVVALDDMQSFVTDPREATRVACPFCASRVMRDATRCFSCWRKLELGVAS